MQRGGGSLLGLWLLVTNEVNLALMRQTFIAVACISLASRLRALARSFSSVSSSSLNANHRSRLDKQFWIITDFTSLFISLNSQ